MSGPFSTGVTLACVALPWGRSAPGQNVPQSSTATIAKAALPATVTILTMDSAALVILASGDSVDRVAAFGGDSAADQRHVRRWNLVESPEGARLVRRDRHAPAA